MYIVVRKSDDLKVEGPVFSSSSPSDDLILANVVKNNGGVLSDYSVYRSPDSAPDSLKVYSGASYSFIWNAGHDTILSLDFTEEDNRRWVVFTTDKTSFLANNNEIVTIGIQIWLPDMSAIDTAITAQKTIPVTTPIGVGYFKPSVTNGIGSFTFKTNLSGLWRFPAPVKRFNGGIRFANGGIEIQSLYPITIL